MLERALRELHLGRVVGLITSRDRAAYEDVTRTHDGMRVVGHLIGSSVHDAVARGIERWKREQER